MVEMDGDEMTRIIWEVIKDKVRGPDSVHDPSGRAATTTTTGFETNSEVYKAQTRLSS